MLTLIRGTAAITKPSHFGKIIIGTNYEFRNAESYRPGFGASHIFCDFYHTACVWHYEPAAIPLQVDGC